jgi:hypothetical protein
MGESIYFAFFASILRAMFLVAGGWLVSQGLVDDGLMREVAAGLALIVVTQCWSFWRIHKRTVIHRWVLLLGLESDPAITPPEVIEAEARARWRDGWLP